MAEYNVQINKYNANNLGYDQLYPQPMKHADTHLLNGSDPINVGELGVSNRNLLDNAYFANPDAIIDQRGGYVVPPGTPYYSDTGLSTQVGTVSAYTKAVKVTDTYGTITVSGTTYYVAWSAAVRGYTGAGYGIDRWKVSSGSSQYSVVLINDDSISLQFTPGTSGSQFVQISEIIDLDLTGFTVTISVLTKDNELLTATGVLSTNYFAAGDLSKFYAAVLMTGGRISFSIVNKLSTAKSFRAAKLELGDKQTLAHQDENGNWVLNDPPPDKGMELLKCQRYMLPLDNLARYRAITITDNAIDFFIPTPSTMRAAPSIAFERTSNPSPTVYNWSTGASQQGFAWSVIAKSSNGVYVRGTKTAHGLSDARVNFPVESYLIANL